MAKSSLFSSSGSEGNMSPSGVTMGGVRTLTPLVITVPGGVSGSMLTTSVKTSSAPTGTLGLVQVTVPLVPTAGVLQVQPAGEASETKVVPPGNGSLNVASNEASGPLFKS